MILPEVWDSTKMVDCSEGRHGRLVCRRPGNRSKVRWRAEAKLHTHTEVGKGKGGERKYRRVNTES